MKGLNLARQFLCVPEELKEIKAVLGQRIKLEYLKDSKRMMGIALWNVKAPQLAGYKIYGNANGYPTLSLDGLKKAGLI